MRTCHAWLLALGIATAGAAMAEEEKRAHAEFFNQDGDAIGAATLRQGPNGTLIQLEVQDLPPGPKAIHIHDTGTCEDHDHGFQASGGHLNPDGKKHGLMHPEGPDAGDLTNFYVHENGYAWAEFFTSRASLDGAIGAKILTESGAALVIHENPDDHISQPIGNAGARIACAVIQAAD
ncbi:superoxide dismutase [Alkalilimnicola ehrlichii]|uniref:Superoxide dismutase [Cu-Zn] n=1 Tax=Alkalilimnicola ehrlichii TaxID=351052 RepID=A0A3E0WMH6_9GAMM|nr:superoxide dismutase [Alkalilimnicola ehrlichii]RFA34164.1 superoxide dismutase [Alkalilimnicola ehrlichii]